jgi:ribosomal protein S6--L-glutamate ligase
MLTLAVASREETFERLREPLAARDIEVAHLRYSERAFDLQEPRYDPDEFDAGYVFPGRAMEGGTIDSFLDVPWLNGREAVLTSRNKSGVVAALERAGVPTPRTVMVSNHAEESELVRAFETVPSPVVVKPNSTTRGIGVALADDVDSFLGIADYLDLVHDYRATGDQSFLVQEYLPDARDYRVMVLDGEYVGAVERRLPESELEAGRWKHNVHRGASAESVELPGELKRLAERTADALDIRFLGVDLLVTEERAVVNETNARPTVDDESKYVGGFYDRLAASIRSL